MNESYHAKTIVAFAHYGVSIETMARALAIATESVESACRRAIERGELQMMPPRSTDDRKSALLSEVTNLRAALEDSRCLIREMTATLDDIRERFWGVATLTQSESAIVGALVKYGTVSRQRLYNILYGSLIDSDQPEPKIIDVLVCKVRKKLDPFAIKIETMWGNGYRMTRENADAMRHLAGYVESPPLAPELAEVA